ncbi:MAG: hypothetical protein OXR67_01825 [Chloroflexota bacterium]|nr:hypothetical protein [Chloroflexota bacterium]MDE2937647.1 hypothetical protein [Chloroflexota bacterium]
MFSNFKWVASALAVAVLVGTGVAFAVETPIAPQHNHDHHPQLDEAKLKVPFDVKMPSKVPENYELTAYTLIESPTEGGKVSPENPIRVTGIALYYENTRQEGGLTRDAIFFEQFLGSKYPGYRVVKGTKTGQHTVLGKSADMWSVSHSKGTQTALVWENADDGIFYNMVTYLSPAETLKLAKSLD